MDTLTPEQQAARAVGMSKGVPEEFAIDCTAIALSNLNIAGVAYKEGDKNVKLYDTRHRDRLRSRRKVIVTSDVFLVTNQRPAATIPSVATVNTEDNHGRQNPATDADPAPSPGALHEPGGSEDEGSPAAGTKTGSGTGSRRRRSGSRR